VHLLPDTIDAGAENQARYLLDGLNRSGEVAPELAYFGAGRAHSAFAEIGIPMRQIVRKRRLRTDLFGRARRLRRAYADQPPIYSIRGFQRAISSGCSLREAGLLLAW